MPGVHAICSESVLFTYPYAPHGAFTGNNRRFVKEELPKIQYANPTLTIEVDKFPKAVADTWQSSLLMEFGEQLFLRLSLSLGS